MLGNRVDAAKLVVDQASITYTVLSGLHPALGPCSFSVGDGEVVSIVGPSGCGKTTLLWSMAGLLDLTGGRICLDGQVITGPSAQIGMVFQDANLLPWRDLTRNIRFPFEIKRTRPDQQWIDHLIERVGLTGYEDRYPRELSGGMQQRAAIVRALGFKPSVLLMDEPFGALDTFTRDEMNRLVEEIWLETRKTIVFVTHSIDEAVFLSDRVLVMSARPGRIAAEFLIPYERPRSPRTMATKEVFDLMNEIKFEIEGVPKGEPLSRSVQQGAPARPARADHG